MTTQERLMEAAKLRLRFQMNNRLRLEFLAALSRVFREHQEAIPDELLANLVLAIPEELRGESETEQVESSNPRQGTPVSPQQPPIGKPPLGKPPLGKPPLGKPPVAGS